MRVFAETALEADETVPVGPKTLLELLDAVERSPFATLRSREVLDVLPDNTVVVANDGILVAYHKRIFPDGRTRWWSTAEKQTVVTEDVPLPATLVFIPKK